MVALVDRRRATWLLTCGKAVKVLGSSFCRLLMVDCDYVKTRDNRLCVGE